MTLYAAKPMGSTFGRLDVHMEQALISLEAEVKPEWIDLNGHMTFWAYGKLFDASADAYLRKVGINEQVQSDEASVLHTSQSHVKFFKECFAHEHLVIELQIVGYDSNSIHIFQRMRNRESRAIVAVEESVKMNLVDKNTVAFIDRAKVFHPKIMDRLKALAKKNEGISWPPDVGSKISPLSEPQ